MTEIVNVDQSAAWNGYEGEHWAARHDRYDTLNGAFNDRLLEAAAIGDRDRVLDIGCGNGQVTRLAARRGRRATGVDLSAPMLARARACAEQEDVPNVTFHQGDAQVHPFPDGAYDVAISRFGIMFFADPVAAFTNVHRALTGNGRLAFLCMDDLTDTALGAVLNALKPFLPHPGPVTGPPRTGPTSLADPAHVDALLTRAGFRNITATHVEAPQLWGRDPADAAEFLSGWGPVRHHLPPEATEPARTALTQAFTPFAGPTGVQVPGTAWLVTAAA
ncbi:class I SAM-dependent methyltransferase [Actinomadura rugatobispora]|uniref:Class I SAM-dependent methyltransferase n=1 Tax=Actinomadura rugatobispora TaxID=1994 RepID=A0ABW1A4L6_9ACTN|nr:class I SAM-dependent methyltransferase [Actinomadura rugatobispora]